jgi:hypothetical protein
MLDQNAVDEARRMAEETLARQPDADESLRRLGRVADSLEEAHLKVVVYLRAAHALRASSADEVTGKYGDAVADALEIVTEHEGDSFADVVMRAAQNPLTYEIVANDIGEELDHLAGLRHAGEGLSDAQESRWQLLILSQALLDRVGRGEDSESGDPEPVVLESEKQAATVYLHPVHGDVVVLVKSRNETEEDWVLIKGAERDVMLLELVAEMLDQPLREGLVPWLEQHDISHQVFTKDEGDGSGALAGE